ncbi:MAG: sugar transferase [Nitrospirae bacterium]|nr:sugar transferase [Nitrospirota bacterium]
MISSFGINQNANKAEQDDKKYCNFPVQFRAKPYSLKRLFDIVFSTFLLVLTFPIVLAVAISIKLCDSGPVFFVQPRVGYGGRAFNIIKFRTMVENAEALKKYLIDKSDVKGAFKMKNDPRVTRIGFFLRKTKLDELPQFINVLFGDMSMVGPRPTSLEEVIRAYGEDACQKFISGIKPGITGPVQIHEAFYGKMDLDEQLQLDFNYIRNNNFFVDLKLVLLTLVAIFAGYKNV